MKFGTVIIYKKLSYTHELHVDQISDSRTFLRGR